jgi:hypothetical protein
MPIPGQNLLNMALTVIAKQPLTYYQFAGRIQNDIGQDITTYNPPRLIYGSWQPVPRKLYEQYGLDWNRDYFILYTSNNTIDVGRDVSGDQVAFDGQRYQCESNTEWFRLDGWNGILCVHIGDDTEDSKIWGFGSTPANSYVNFGNGNFMSTDP